MTDKEYEFQVRRLDYNVSTRMYIVTFSFTTVLATLGLALGTSNETINAFVYLLPFGLIVPLTGRIVYYRLIHAHISAYIMTYAPEHIQFSIKSRYVEEKQDNFFIIIALLNNYEMFILSLMCTLIFLFKYKNTIESFSYINYIICSIPIILNSIVFIITKYGYDYSFHLQRYLEKWSLLKKFEK